MRTFYTQTLLHTNPFCNIRHTTLALWVYSFLSTDYMYNTYLKAPGDPWKAPGIQIRPLEKITQNTPGTPGIWGFESSGHPDASFFHTCFPSFTYRTHLCIWVGANHFVLLKLKRWSIMAPFSTIRGLLWSLWYVNNRILTWSHTRHWISVNSIVWAQISRCYQTKTSGLTTER